MKNLLNFIKTKPSIILIWIMVLVSFYKVGDFHIYKRPSLALGWDGACYYSYLPATIVHHDLSFSYIDSLKNPESQRSTAFVIFNGKKISKTTCGVAVLCLPFYTLAHIFMQFTGQPPDGYEPVYLFFICVGAVIYCMLGFIILRKILLKYFNEIVTTLTLTCIYFGTNLYYYTVREPFMSHFYSFFLVSLLVFYGIDWSKKITVKNTLILAFILGLITLIRPTNIVFAGIPLLINIHSIKTLREKLLIIFKSYKAILPGSLLFISVIFIQLVAWKSGTGSWLVLSYGKEGFFWLKPHFIDGLFSYRKGWLVYTPIMIFAILGLFFLRKKLQPYSWTLPFTLIINMYIIFSWWCWWYGGSWGMRALIDSYPLWTLCFAAFVDKVVHIKSKVFAITFVTVITFFISTNIHHTRQYRIAHIHHDSMTKEAFWAGFWREAPPEGSEKLLKAPDYKAALEGKEEY